MAELEKLLPLDIDPDDFKTYEDIFAFSRDNFIPKLKKYCLDLKEKTEEKRKFLGQNVGEVFNSITVEHPFLDNFIKKLDEAHKLM